MTRAHRYEPELNRTYEEMAAHYGAAVIPGRPRKPRDKAKVEVGVLIVERWILATLRNLTFFSLAEANAAIRERLTWLNDRPFKKLPGSRRSQFAEIDRPALRPLPAKPYEYATWKQATVNIDYHVEIERHWYSVPYALVGLRLDVRLSVATIEVFHRGRRVASHLRSSQPGRHTTESAHMPESHRRHLEWTPGRIVRWSTATGPATGELVSTILASRPHPEQGFRSCLGILRLCRRYGDERLEAAATRALAIRAHSYRSVESILKRGLDRTPLPAPPRQPMPAATRTCAAPPTTSDEEDLQMLTTPTLDKLRALNLPGMARALNTHKPNHDRWLTRHRNVHFHFTPTHASWLNQVEVWFSILSRRALVGARHTSPRQVRGAIDRFVGVYNETAAPFEWQKGSGSI